MDEQTANLLREVRTMTDFDLQQVFHTRAQGSPPYIAAKVEIERRARKHAFWRKDIVAWLALGLAIISLVVSIFK